MKKTRILALVLAVLMLAGIFAGCAKTPASSTAPAPSQTTDSKTESQKPQELVDIVWYVYAAAVRNNEKNVVAAMNEYSKEKIGVTVTMNTLLSTDYNNKLSMDLASDADIDMMFLASWQGQQDLIQSKAVMDITDLLPNYPKLLAVMPEEIWTSAEFGGRRYLIPNYKEAFLGYSFLTPKAVADKVKAEKGIDFKTIELNGVLDLEKIAPYVKAAKEVCGVTVGFGELGLWNAQCIKPGQWEYITGSYYVDNKTDKVNDYRLTDEYEQFLNTVYQLNKDGLIPEEAATKDYVANILTDYLKKGDYATEHWTTVPDNENNASMRYNTEVYAIPLTGNYQDSGIATGSDYAIAAKSKKADACLRYLELLNTDTKLADMYVYGQEGVDFKYNADGLVEVSENKGWDNAVWKCCSYLTPTLAVTEAKDKKEQYTEANKSATAYRSLGFRADTTAVKPEMAAVDNVAEQYSAYLNYGFYKAEDKLEEYRTELKKAGIEKVIAEMQSQYDAWLKEVGK